ncbi:MAG: hypothetical protein JHD16_06100 [Solirubrobacteraceae bacterium]|nr:hypothetical protein [Solirubrobacteraceae bacterium]
MAFAPLLRTVNDAADWGRRAERRLEPLYRAPLDRVIQQPLVGGVQWLINRQREQDITLGLAEERVQPDEEDVVERITDLLRTWVRTHYRPGHAQRAGNTKTYGIVRAELHVLPDLPDRLRRGVFAYPGAFRAWVRFGGPGPLAPPDLDDNGVLSIGVKVMGVPGPKLIDDEHATQDFLGLTSLVFQSPDVVNNVELHEHVADGTPLFYYVNGSPTRLLEFALQALGTRVYASPLEVQYNSCVPYLLGDGQAIKFRFVPQSTPTPVPLRPGDNYLHEAMVDRLSGEDVVFDMLVQRQTDPFKMPIENASVIWPDELSAPVKVAELRIPAQAFDSPEQMAFAGNLSMNPWHALPAHRPLGSLNRARKQMYYALSKDRQQMNGEQRIEPTGDEVFPGSPALPLSRPAPPSTAKLARPAGRSTRPRARKRTPAAR